MRLVSNVWRLSKSKKYKKDKPTLTTFWNNLFSVYDYDANVGRELYFERKPLVFS